MRFLFYHRFSIDYYSRESVPPTTSTPSPDGQVRQSADNFVVERSVSITYVILMGLIIFILLVIIFYYRSLRRLPHRRGNWVNQLLYYLYVDPIP